MSSNENTKLRLRLLFKCVIHYRCKIAFDWYIYAWVKTQHLLVLDPTTEFSLFAEVLMWYCCDHCGSNCVL